MPAVHVKSDAALRVFLAQKISKRVRRVLDEFQRVRKAPTAEATHDLSTAMRRLLVCDYVVRQLYGRRLLGKKLRRRIKDFRGVLGGVRDVQEMRRKFVSLGFKSAFNGAFLGRLCDMEKELAGELLSEAEDFDARPLEELRSGRNIAKLCRGGPVVEPAALIARLFEDVKAMVDRAIRGRDDEALHRMRIRFKRYRYTVEVLAPDFSGADEERLSYLREFQTRMGEAHDWLILSEEMCGFSRKHNVAGARVALLKVQRIARQAHADARRWISENLERLEA